jgi:CRP-like cAMP-binding protein
MLKIPLTQSEIASWVGIQRETVSRQFKLMAEKGLIEYKNEELYIDVEKLSAEHLQHRQL